MKKIFFIFIGIFLLYSKSPNAEIRFYFSPSPDCENQIIRHINNTKSTLDIVIYSLTNERIVNAIEEAAKRGVQIRILADRTQAGSKWSKVIALYNNGINIRVNSKHKTQHNKLAVFDNEVIVNGSYNWTRNTTANNSENCAFITDEPESVKTVVNEINRLWALNTKEKSDKWFAKRRRKL